MKKGGFRWSRGISRENQADFSQKNRPRFPKGGSFNQWRGKRWVAKLTVTQPDETLRYKANIGGIQSANHPGHLNDEITISLLIASHGVTSGTADQEGVAAI